MISIQSVGYKKIHSFFCYYSGSGSGSNFFIKLIVSDCIASEGGKMYREKVEVNVSHSVINTMKPMLAESKHITRDFFHAIVRNISEVTSHASTGKKVNRARLLSFNLSETKRILMRIFFLFVFQRNSFSAIYVKRTDLSNINSMPRCWVHSKGMTFND